MAKKSPKKASAPKPCAEQIRIGTLVNAGPGTDPAAYIRQILPHGFESFSLMFWQTLGGRDLKQLAAEVREALAGSGAVISSLGIFGNALKGDEMGTQTLDGWRKCIDAARLFDCDIVAGFAGRVEDVPIDQSMKAFKRVYGPLARRAADKGVRLAFENCDMDGDWQRGGWNIAQNPTAWEMMFDAVPADNLGLQWEPCHQMVSLIDPLPQLAKWVGRVFHVHGKDATVRWDIVREHGVHGPHQFAWHRTPGFGDTNWADVITILRMAGFVGSIDIEGWHDPVYRRELEMTGQVAGLNYLKRCRGGTFVPNPK
jgi:sugar phosphate isomerase/epimerase